MILRHCIGMSLLFAVFAISATGAEDAPYGDCQYAPWGGYAAPSQAITDDTFEVGEQVFYKIILAEVTKGNSGRQIVRSVSRNGQSVFDGLIETKKLSVCTSPHIMTIVGTPAHIVVGNGTEMSEMKLLPVRLENDKVLTKIESQLKEIHNGKEKSYQWTMSGNLPTNNKGFLVRNTKLGDKEFILFVLAFHIGNQYAKR